MRLIAALSLSAAPALAAPVTAGALAYARYIEDNQLTHRRYSRLPMLDLGERQTANAVSLYGNCSDLCEGAISFVVDACGTGGEIQDIIKCKTACTTSASSNVQSCEDCTLSPNSSASEEGKNVASGWITWLSDSCPAILETPDPVTSRPCDECVPINPIVMNACNTSNPNACRGLCSNLDAMHGCVDCYNKAAPGSFDEFNSYVGDADWYCQTDGGQACSAMMADADELCGGQDMTKCKEICKGTHFENIKKCESAVGNSGLTGTQSKVIADGVKMFVEYCQTETTTTPNKTGCAKECDSILAKNTDLCGGKDAAKCREMCTDPNLGALDLCNECSQGDQSLYTATTKSSIQANLNTLRTWCQTATTKPDDPEVISTVPDPKDIEQTTKEEEESKPPSNNPIKNPFVDSNESTKDSNTKESKGFPTWGIGAAVGGGAVVIIALVSSIVACNYECDHDHRRLRRRRKKNNKKDDNDKPYKQQQQQQQQQPMQQQGGSQQLVGYIYPNPNDGRPVSQGYFPGPGSPPMSTPLSPPVPLAHTPIGPISPPNSPPPFGQYQRPGSYTQPGYGQQQYPAYPAGQGQGY